MADIKPLEQKLLEVLEADAALVALLATDDSSNTCIYLANMSPVDINYPCLNFRWVEMISQPRITAQKGMIQFYITTSKESADPYGDFVKIRDRLKEMFNRNDGEPLTEIGGAEEIRVVKILKVNSIFKYEEKPDKFVSLLQFDIVKSEDEDFDTSYGNGTWN